MTSPADGDRRPPALFGGRDTARRRLAAAYAVVAVVAFGMLAAVAARTAYWPMDLTVARAVQAVDAPGFAALMTAVSWPGYFPQSWFLVGALALVLALRGLRRESLVMVLATTGAATSGWLVKLIAHRTRPTGDLVRIARDLTGFSYPSGHVVFYTTCLGFLVFVLTRGRPTTARSITALALAGAIVLVGPSRVYLGGHWPSDVVGAYLLGSAWLVAAAFAWRGPGEQTAGPASGSDGS